MRTLYSILKNGENLTEKEIKNVSNLLGGLSGQITLFRCVENPELTTLKILIALEDELDRIKIHPVLKRIVFLPRGTCYIRRDDYRDKEELDFRVMVLSDWIIAALHPYRQNAIDRHYFAENGR